MSAVPPTFIADVMLGRLTKWLRLLGTDTAYAPNLSSTGLVRRAVAERRILLTRNQRLLRRSGLPPHLDIHADHFRAQLREVFDAFHLDWSSRLFARCCRCNEPLTAVQKAAVRHDVPFYVFQTQSAFSRCAVCQRIYWPATHVEQIKQELAQAGLGVRG